MTARRDAYPLLPGSPRVAWRQTLLSRLPLLSLLVLFAIYGAWQVASLQGIPDSPWGGDSYAQVGIATAIHQGNPPWEDAHFLGEWAFRDWLPFLLLAAASRLAGVAPVEAARAWPLLVALAGGVVVHALARRVAGRESIALLAAGAWMAMHAIMLPTSRAFAATLMVPLALFAFATMDERPATRVRAGIAYGLASLSYLVAFFGLTLLLVAMSARRLAARRGELRRALAQEARRVGPVWLAALPIILLLWGPILLVYGGKVQNPSHLYGDAARGWTWAQSVAPLRALFLDTSSLARFVLSALALAGVYASARRWREGGAWVIGLLAVGLVGTYHWIVTMPLVGNHLVYYRFPDVFLRLAQVLLATQALALVLAARPRRDRYGARRLASPALVGALAVGLVAATPGAYWHDVNPEWLAAARGTPIPEARAVAAAGAWARGNTDKDAVFLGLPLESFAFHAYSGRKLVVERRPHANAFVDLDRRYADAAVMLFGTDANLTRRLLDEYKVDYLVRDPFHERFLPIDPLMTSPAYAPYWDAAGVPYVRLERAYDTIGDGQRFDVIAPYRPAPNPVLAEDFEVVFEAEGGSGPARILARR